MEHIVSSFHGRLTTLPYHPTMLSVPNAPDLWHIAWPRLLHLLKNMVTYVIEEQEKRGFIERIDNSLTPKAVHYIPHHPVKKESTTTPIRIVYDCSCKQSPDSPSLNDCLTLVLHSLMIYVPYFYAFDNTTSPFPQT